jgi:hypothetical protein
MGLFDSARYAASISLFERRIDWVTQRLRYEANRALIAQVNQLMQSHSCRFVSVGRGCDDPTVADTHVERSMCSPAQPESCVRNHLVKLGKRRRP